jgi:transcription elongation factor GreA
VTQPSAQENWLTQADFDRLTAELEYLTGPGRAEIVDKIETARAEGDLKENGGYHAAKDEQGKIEARIAQLIQLLRNAQVGEAEGAASGEAGPGMVVKVRYDGDDDTETFLIGSREMAGDSGLEAYSPQSPIGAAITGNKAGAAVSFTTPNGKTVKLTLVEVTAYHG